MADYISREAVKLAIVDAGQSGKRYKIGEFWELNRDEAWAAIDSVPSADVAPVRHGRWEIDYSIDALGCKHVMYRCSLCGVPQNWDEFEYCPFCGGRMDGDVDG